MIFHLFQLPFTHLVLCHRVDNGNQWTEKKDPTHHMRGCVQLWKIFIEFWSDQIPKKKYKNYAKHDRSHKLCIDFQDFTKLFAGHRFKFNREPIKIINPAKNYTLNHESVDEWRPRKIVIKESKQMDTALARER